MKIREDIYPNFKGPERGKLLEKEVILISEAFENFRTRDDVVDYLKKLSNPKVAELFLETGRFYFSAKFHYCPHCGTKFDACPNSECQETFMLPAHIVFVMMISIMEKLARGLKTYEDFYDWVNSRKIARKYQAKMNTGKIATYGKLIESLRDEYRNEYGLSTKITEFFRRFLNKDEKIEFIRSIRYVKKAPDLPPRLPDIEAMKKVDLEDYFRTLEKERVMVFKTNEDLKRYVQTKDLKSVPQPLPDCFDTDHYWKCYSKDLDGHGFGYCHYNLFESHCRLMQDEELLDEYFQKTVKTIYDWRSEFVHDARLPPIREIVDIVFDFYERKKKQVIVEINIKRLTPTFERMYKRYFEAFQVGA